MASDHTTTTSSSTTIQPAEAKTRLIKHFETRSINDQISGWSSLWDTNSSDLWDRGRPSPALVDILEEQEQERRDLFTPFTADGRRKKVLVPGCGKGYDVVMLALHGFDAYGLDVSATGVSVAREYAKSELEHPHAYNFGDSSPFSPEKIQIQGGRGRGQVTIIQGDFFKSDWEFKEKQNGVKFDLIYDYTFLCALHPKMRQQWAFRMADLLTPTGLLVCLEFPLWKDLKLPGPPWGLNGVHWNLLAEGGDGIFYDDGYGFRGGEGEGKGAFTRKLYVKPVRSYEQGRGTDMLSVYVKK